MFSQSSKKARGKQLFALILALVMVIGLLPAMTLPVKAAEGAPEAMPADYKLKDGGNYELRGGTDYSGNSFVLEEGVAATVTIPAGETVTIDNRNKGGAPFVIEPYAILRLVVDGTLVLYGQNGTDGGSGGGGKGWPGGKKGYAAINVQSGGYLGITGSGSLTAFGGDAGDGGAAMGGSWSIGNNAAAGGGSGAGAGIGGNGGNGGRGAYARYGIRRSEAEAWKKTDDLIGQPGTAGESAGIIAIDRNVQVHARGGAGGSGGAAYSSDHSGGSGGGGYPAAGIGGGGAGAGGGASNQIPLDLNWLDPATGNFKEEFADKATIIGAAGGGGGGGYSGGGSGGRSYTIKPGAVNGAGGPYGWDGRYYDVQAYAGGGGGYWSEGEAGKSDGTGAVNQDYGEDKVFPVGVNGVPGAIGGGGGANKSGGTVGDTYNKAGDGGTAGGGGRVYLHNTANVTAENGNRYTDDSGKFEATPIKYQTEKAPAYMGIGSGAGYVENNNGVCYVVESDSQQSGAVTNLRDGQTLTLTASETGRSYVLSGGEATLEVPAGANVTLDNRAGGGSPISVAPGAKLNLKLSGTLTVYGEAGTSGESGSTMFYLAGGSGGFAGVNVPEGATLMVSGTGRLNAYGGDAGDGGENVGGAWRCTTYYPVEGDNSIYKHMLGENAGGGGGAGAGAGIGGNGGDGGNGAYPLYGWLWTDLADVAAGKPGGNGQSAGNIIFLETDGLQVYARGGAGGSGGWGGHNDHGGAAGGGGYPAAGIGGGGAGAGGGASSQFKSSGGGGGGGFSGGGGSGRYGVKEDDERKPLFGAPGVNGQGGTGGNDSEGYLNSSQRYGGGGGGYFAAGQANMRTDGTLNGAGGAQYGGGGYSYFDRASTSMMKEYFGVDASGTIDEPCQFGGNGGTSGGGGTVVAVQSFENITAQNGDAITDGKSAYTPTKIRTQVTQGFGAGAGYVEPGNGQLLTKGTHIDLTNQTVTEFGGTEHGKTASFAEILAGTANLPGVALTAGDVTTVVLTDNGNAFTVLGETDAYNLKIGGDVQVKLDSARINMMAHPGYPAVELVSGVTAVITGSGTTALYGANAVGLTPGEPGIKVPDTADVTLRGVLSAYGGDASDGQPGAAQGGDGGSGAGAGIGGAGGIGGSGNGTPGGDAQVVGSIHIEGKINAYGGGGGFGGSGNASYGGGGGGYPAAGIGGGGAGAGAGGANGGGDGYSGGGGKGSGADGGTDGSRGYGTGGGRGFASGTTTYAGAGGGGGEGKLIDVIESSGTVQNGKSSTKNSSFEDNWISTSVTTIGQQITQGFGVGAGGHMGSFQLNFHGVTIEVPAISGNSSATLRRIIPATEDEHKDKIASYQLSAKEVFENGDTGETLVKRTVSVPSGSKGELTNVVVPGLENGHTYNLYATPVYSDGTPSKISTPVQVLVGLPKAPTNVKVDASTSYSTLVEFDPADGNGNPIEYYIVYVNGVAYPNAENPTHFTDTKMRLESEEGGVDLAIQVQSFNRVGGSDLTEPAKLVTGTPTAPNLLKVIAGNNDITLEWEKASPNGLKMTGYNVYLKTETEAAGTNWSKIAGSGTDTKIAADATSFTLPVTLKPGTEYSLYVTAENVIGESQPSNIRMIRYGVPTAPNNLEVASGSEMLTVRFTAPDQTGSEQDGSTGVIKQYNVYVNSELKKTIQDTEVIIDGLTNGMSYEIYVTAVNGSGESPKSESVIGRPATKPDVPRGVVAEAKSDTEVEVTWKAPQFNGGADMERYQIITYSANGDQPVGGPVYADGSATSAVINGLTPGESYYFTVAAKNKVETSYSGTMRSDVVKTWTLPGVPEITGWSSARNGTSYDLTVNWKAPDNDGGTDIIGYKVWLNKVLMSGGMLPADTTSFTIQGLKATKYTVRVESFNAVNSSAAGNKTFNPAVTASEQAVIRAIQAPVIDRVTTGADGSVTVTWNPVDDEFTNYRVYGVSADSEDGMYTKETATAYMEGAGIMIACSEPIEKGGKCSYTFDSLELNGTLFVAVRCFSSGDYGYLSEVYEVTPYGAAEPQNLTAEAGYQSIDVGFDTVTAGDLNGNSLVGYEVLLNGAVCENPIEVGQGDLVRDGLIPVERVSGKTSVAATIQDVAGNADYTVSVRAVTETTDGSEIFRGLMATAPAVTVWTNPSAIITAREESGNHEFTVNFTAASVKGNGLDIQGYAVFLEREGADWQNEPVATVAEPGTVLITDVKNGYKDPNTSTGWIYYVLAYTEKDGQRYYSAVPENPGTVATGIPEAPIITDVEVEGTSVTVSYVSPSSFILAMAEEDAAEDEMKYIVLKDNNPVNSEATTDRSMTIEGLDIGVSYSLAVQATNEIGTSPLSDPVVVKIGAPNAPEIYASDVEDGTISVTWYEPVSNDGSKISTYTVYYTGPDGIRQTKQISDGSITQAKITDLINGEEYTVTVTASNATGEGLHSKEVRLTPRTVPGMPVEVQAAAVDATTVEVNWLAPVDDGGAAIDRYEIMVNGVKQVTVQADSQDPETQRYSARVDSGLAGGESYQFSVRAHNASGYGDASAPVTARILTVPGKPEMRGASGVNGLVTVMWADSEDDGGSPATGYELRVYRDGQLIFDPVEIPVEDVSTNELGEKTYITPMELESNVRYQVTVTVVNKIGAGEESGPNYFLNTSALSPDTVPGQPSQVELKSGNGALTVSWNAPSIVGTGIIAYDIYYRESGSTAEASSLAHKDTTNLTDTITGLTNGTEYEVWIVATNTIGSGPQSAHVSGTPKELEKPSIPSGMKYESNLAGNVITLKWNPVETTDGGAMTYLVYVNGTDAHYASTMDAQYVLKDVQANTPYKIWIVAQNKNGSSAEQEGGLDAARPHMIANSSMNIVSGDTILNPDPNYDGTGSGGHVQKPTAPKDVAAVLSETADSIQISWAVPVNEDTGDEIDGIEFYHIYVNGMLVKSLSTDEMDTMSFTYPEDGSALVGNRWYSVEVSAQNVLGEGPKSEPQTVYVAADDTPTGLKAVYAPGSGSVHLTWKAPGVTPTSYTLMVNGVQGHTLGADATETDYTVDYGSEYAFCIVANYEQNVSRYSNTEVVTAKLEMPEAPANLTAEAVENGIKLTWDGTAGTHMLTVNGGEPIEITAEEVSGRIEYVYETTAEDAYFTFKVQAVNSATIKGETKTEISAESNTAVGYLPAAGTGGIELPDPPVIPNPPEIVGNEITFTWEPVTPGEGQTLARYEIYVSVDGAAPVPAENGTFTREQAEAAGYMYRYTETDSDGHEYAFSVQPVFTTTEKPSEEIKGEPSTPGEITTKPTVPDAPVNLGAEVSGGNILLTWDAVPGADRYKVYLDSEEVTKDSALADPTYLYEVTGDRKNFFFRVTAINATGESEKSEGISVDLNKVEEKPAASTAPVIRNAAHNVENKTIRVHWSVLPYDTMGHSLTEEDFTGFNMSIMNGETSVMNPSLLTKKTDENANGYVFNAEKSTDTELWFYYDVDVSAWTEATQYAVTVLAWCNEVPSASSNSWIAVLNLNVDTDGDGEPDDHLDPTGSGTEYIPEGHKVVLTAQVTAGGNAALDPDVEITTASQEKISYEKLTYADGVLTVEFYVNAIADAGTAQSYKLRITKSGCTYYELTAIPMITSIKEIKLSDVTLYIGDTNGDGRIDSSDISLIKKNYRETVNAYTNGDVTGDGKVDASDLSLVNANYRKRYVEVDFGSLTQ